MTMAAKGGIYKGDKRGDGGGIVPGEAVEVDDRRL